jgi:hypothetical protein
VALPPLFPLSLTGRPALSAATCGREPKQAARVWATPTGWAGPVTGLDFCKSYFFIYFIVLNAVL